MKNILLLIILLVAIKANCQAKMKIEFTDGKIETGIFRIARYNLPERELVVSKGKKKKYKLSNIKKVTEYTKTDTILYYKILTKKYKKSAIIERLGVRSFKGNSIELYYVPTTIHAYGLPGIGGTPTTFSSNSRLAFVKRTNEDVALNMGYIFGAGQRGIKKRVREYFTDCNDLITKVNKNKIKKKRTLEIVKYYEEKCNKTSK